MIRFIKIANSVGEQKVYSEFFTSLAVAWFSAGVITPLISRPKDPSTLFFIILMGIMGTAFSLKAATIFAKEEK